VVLHVRVVLPNEQEDDEFEDAGQNLRAEAELTRVAKALEDMP